MRKRCSFLAVLMAAAPLTLLATRPTIIVNGDPPDPTLVTSTAFTFGADAKGGGDLAFQNGSGQNWHELTVTVSLPTVEPINCGFGPFSTCTVVTTPEMGSVLYTIIFGPNPRGGITNGELFSINLNDQIGISPNPDPNGPGSWGAGNDFTATANSPEPAALGLSLAGFALLGLCVYRRRASAG